MSISSRSLLDCPCGALLISSVSSLASFIIGSEASTLIYGRLL